MQKMCKRDKEKRNDAHVMEEKKSTLIEFDHVSKTYLLDKPIHALQNISLRINQRDIYGIIGLSGAGKSTLIRCLASLINPTAGKIIFHQQDISQLKGRSLRDFRLRIGMIFQHFNLFQSRTVAQNISYPLEIAHIPADQRMKRVNELLGLVGLETKKNVYPSILSGGEKQRVGVARALANGPELLLCDEATSALDPKTSKEILDLLKKINEKLGVTIVLITHDMEVIKRICNKVAVIESGKMIEEGSTYQVFSDPQNPTTQNFIQKTSHEIPEEFFKPSSPNRKLLRLRFKGSSAGEPIISHLVKQFHVEANILLGWIDHLQMKTVGTLIIELTGTPEGIENSLKYLNEKSVVYEELVSNG
jgi:D-methionine transport system ATP-binding protein